MLTDKPWFKKGDVVRINYIGKGSAHYKSQSKYVGKEVVLDEPIIKNKDSSYAIGFIDDFHFCCSAFIEHVFPPPIGPMPVTLQQSAYRDPATGQFARGQK